MQKVRTHLVLIDGIEAAKKAQESKSLYEQMPLDCTHPILAILVITAHIAVSCTISIAVST